MKKLLCTALLCLGFGATNSQAADYPMGIGAYLTGKLGVNVGKIPEGTQTGVAFTVPDIGVTGYIPFGRTSIAGMLDLGYAQYGYVSKATGSSSDKSLTYGYLNIAPGINFSGFTLGVNFGIPMSAPEGGKTEDMATLTEIRLGGQIPVYEDRTGRVNIVVLGGYTLTGLIKEELLKSTFGGVTIDNTEFNPKVASLSFGVNYIFNMGR